MQSGWTPSTRTGVKYKSNPQVDVVGREVLIEVPGVRSFLQRALSRCARSYFGSERASFKATGLTHHDDGRKTRAPSK